MSRSGFLLGSLVFCLVQSGCCVSPRNPIFEEEDSLTYTYSSSKIDLRQRITYLTYDFYVSLAWEAVYKASDPRFSVFVTDSAAEYFNEAWRLSQEGYDPYWGWGIIRLGQAEKTCWRARKKKYLQDAVRYMEMARAKKSFEVYYANAIRLDEARGLVALAREYQKDGEPLKAAELIEKAGTLVGSLDPIGDYEASRRARLLQLIERIGDTP
ncbi:MAG: hypothetical protein ACI4R9_07175 [Kiritimatiellia bacterium]